MSASATSIPDVLSVRPSSTTAAAEPAGAPILDFSAIVALLQRALQPPASAAAVVPGTRPAADPATTPLPGDAPSPPAATAATVLLPSSPAATAAPLPSTPLVALAALAPVIPVVGRPASEPAADLVPDLEPRLLPDAGLRDEVEVTVSGDAPPTAPGRRNGERAGLAVADESANDERSMAGDDREVAAAPLTAVALPGFVPPMPAPSSFAAAASDATIADSALAGSAASPVPALGSSRPTHRGAFVPPAPSSPERATPSTPSHVVAGLPPQSVNPLAPPPASPMPGFVPAASTPVVAAAAPGSFALEGAPSLSSPAAAAAASAAPAPAAALAATRSALPAESATNAPRATDPERGEPATEAEPIVPARAPRADHATQESGPVTAGTLTPRSASTEADARVTRRAAEPVTDGTDGIPPRVAAARTSGAQGIPVPGDATSPTPSARDAAATMRSDATPVRPMTIADGAASYDGALAASRELVSDARRSRSETFRESAPPDGMAARASERGGQDAAPPVEAGAMSFDAWTSPSRATGADEPAQPEGVRAPVVEQVVTRLREVRSDGHHEISMRLDPPDLGGVTIDARLDAGRLTVHIRAEYGSTQELLTDALPRLRESLAQQGFVPEQVSVELSFDGGGAAGGGAARDGARSFTAPPSPVPPPPAPTRAPRVTVPASVPGTRGGLDVWA